MSSLSDWMTRNVAFLCSQYIALNSPQALLFGPEAERDGRQAVHQRHCVAIFGQINGAQIVLAGLAGFHADVRQLVRNIDGQVVLALFPAKSAQDAAEFPLLRAK